MKNIFKSFICFILVTFTLIISGCSNKNSNENNSTNNNPQQEEHNEEYYSMLGYHKIEFDDYIKITSEDENVVEINTKKLMVPNNTNISISFNAENNSDFKLNNNNFVNFKDGTILSSFKVNDTSYNPFNLSIKIKKDTTISAEFVSFETVGVSCYQIDEFKEPTVDCSGKFESLESATLNLDYFCATNSNIESFSKSKVETNSTINLKTQESSGTFSLNVDFEIFMETTDIIIYLILKDENSSFYNFEIYSGEAVLETLITKDGFSNNNSELESVSIFLSNDISTRDSY